MFSSKYLPLVFGLAIFFTLHALWMQKMGIVGEISASWTNVPQVLAEVDPVSWSDGLREPTAGDKSGIFVASHTRPMERLQIGPFWLPLAVNQYTGGVPDWPARFLYAFTGSVTAVLFMNLLFGGFLIGLVWWLLSTYTNNLAAAISAIWLACDWSFGFYKVALGGTEIALQLAWIILLWGILERRKTGRGWQLIAVGIGLGLHAKIPYAFSLIPLAICCFVTRPLNTKRKINNHLVGSGLIILAFLLPMLICWFHHGHLEPIVRSHDGLQMQFDRVVDSFLGEQRPQRESFSNLWIFMSDPLHFFERVYQAKYDSVHLTFLRIGSFLIACVGSAWAWKEQSPNGRVLRFITILLILQLLVIGWLAKDMHHLAMATPTMAIWMGLSIAAVADRFAANKYLLASLLLIPSVIVGIQEYKETDQALESITTPTFSKDSQKALIAMLKKHNVNKLVTMDYEIYGVLEALHPTLETIHFWGAVSHQEDKRSVLPAVLKQAQNGYIIAVQSSVPMIYNLRPSVQQLSKHAAQLGLTVIEVERSDKKSMVLFRVLTQSPQLHQQHYPSTK